MGLYHRLAKHNHKFGLVRRSGERVAQSEQQPAAALPGGEVEITAAYVSQGVTRENNDGTFWMTCTCKVLSGPKPEGTVIASFSGTVSDPDEFRNLMQYRWLGEWTTYRDQPQFKFRTFVVAQPAERSGVIAYLARAGEGLGIGKARAAELWEQFGQEAVRVVRETPENAAEAIKGWSVDQAKQLSASLKKMEVIEACSIELISLFEKRGFPRNTWKKALDLWGNVAAEVIRHDPYKLMQFRNCGFKRCDAMYLSLKLPPDRLKRQALCAWHSIASDSEGHTWFPATKAINAIRNTIRGAQVDPARALKLAKRAGAIGTQRTDSQGKLVTAGGFLWIAEGKNADNERNIATDITSLSRTANRWPEVISIPGLTDHQRENLAKAFAGPIGILGGSPGTGKTYTAAAAILSFIKSVGLDGVAVCAPTGKAAVRLSEALDAYGVPIRAKTIHSLLKVDPQGDGSGGWSFYYRRGRPLPFKVLVVDESSMIDTDLMCSLLFACAAGTHILFVGDINQLPPVGHGAPLRDMIAAGLPYGELREIIRQAAGSMIVQACAAIRDYDSKSKRSIDLPCIVIQEGEPLDAITLDEIAAGCNQVLIVANTPEGQTRRLQEVLTHLATLGFDPTWDCQPLAAVNKKSDLSRTTLNKLLQGQLNASPGEQGCPFRVGDKVVNTKNGYFALCAIGGDDESDLETNERGEVYVANGELARIVEVGEKYFAAKPSAPERLVRVPRGKAATTDGGEPDGDTKEDDAPKTGCTFDLGYCLSTHKSQGSDWPVTITMLDTYAGAMRVACKEWLYTALSRPKKLGVMIGRMDTAQRMVRRVAIGDRKTFLKELIEREQIAHIAEEL